MTEQGARVSWSGEAEELVGVYEEVMHRVRGSEQVLLDKKA